MSFGFYNIPRLLDFSFDPNPRTGSAAVFLWGARQTGKTTLLKTRLPDALYLDLLDTDLSAELLLRPALLRQRVLAERPEVVVLDEIQKVPVLLEQVHWLLENTATRFVLCGSSARKLRRGGVNLLGGRATEARLFPLTSAELPDIDLERYINHGGLPAHYLSEDPVPLLRSYVNTYLKQEIIEESVTRNIPAFSRFLEIVGLTHARELNFTSVARECGVSAATVRNYYQILEDTLMGFRLEPWRHRKRMRLVETSKFYLFDTGVALYLMPEGHRAIAGTDLFGRAFEQFVINEMRAWCEYRRSYRRLYFWRTYSGYEVDLVVGDMELAVEIKASRRVTSTELKSLRRLREEFSVGRSIVVCREDAARTTEDGIEILPWREFCARLWAGEILEA
ncbi:MAG: ATP-binding protein [Deltaproteobacteria bacterium]|nr:MAG: ATP-binding protein [Deltaproteobacteria bacterium]